MNKRNVIVFSSITAVVLAAVGLIIGLCLMPVGLSNRKDITINSFFGGEALTLDVKMVKGVYNPDYNLFNSNLSLKELCEMRANKSDGEYSYNYEICGKNAIVYKLKSGKIVAFAELCDVSSVNAKQRYLFTNGAYTIGETAVSIAAPYHMARDMGEWGKASDKLCLNETIGFESVVEFYKNCGDCFIEASDNAVTIKTNEWRVRIEFIPNEKSLLFSVIE